MSLTSNSIYTTANLLFLCQLDDNDIDDDKMPGKSNFLSKVFI